MDSKFHTSYSFKSTGMKKQPLTGNDLFTFDDRKNLVQLKKNLAEKFFRDLSNKYFKLISDKKYDTNDFYEEFEKELQKSYNFYNPDYKSFFRKLEKVFLNKIQNLDNKNIYNNEDILYKKKFHNKKIKTPTPIKIRNNIKFDNCQYKCKRGFSSKNLKRYQNDNDKQAFVKDQINLIYSQKRQLSKHHENKYISSKFSFEENKSNRAKFQDLKMEYSIKLLSQIKEKENKKKLDIETEAKNKEEEYLRKLQEEQKFEMSQVKAFRKKCQEDKIEFIRYYRNKDF